MQSINIDEMKEEYFLSGLEKLDDIESNLLKLERSDDQDSLLSEVFREVHSLKGGSSSYELYVLSNVCHRFEDYLSGFLRHKGSESDFVNTSLAFVDVAKNCINDHKNGSTEMAKYSTIIDSIYVSKVETKGKILLVDPTSSMRKIFSKFCKEFKFEFTQVSDGGIAMSRVLYEKFDLIITSASLDIIDGVSFATGVRLVSNINKSTPLVMISSNENIEESIPKYLSVNKIINKDNDFIKVVSQFLNDFSSKRTVTSKGKKEKIKFKNVLYVEDDKMLQVMIKKIFDLHPDLNVTITSNLENTIGACILEKPDLIVFDYILDGITGAEVLKIMSEKNITTDIPVVFSTASPEHLDLKELGKLGNVRGIIPKPISPNRLINDLNELL